MKTEFKTFTNEDWMSYAGCEGAPMIARPSVDHFKGSNVLSIDIIIDVTGVSVFMINDEYETNSFFKAEPVQGRDEPSQAAMDRALIALGAAESAMNHLELAGALALDGWEFIPC